MAFLLWFIYVEISPWHFIPLERKPSCPLIRQKKLVLRIKIQQTSVVLFRPTNLLGTQYLRQRFMKLARPKSNRWALISHLANKWVNSLVTACYSPPPLRPSTKVQRGWWRRLRPVKWQYFPWLYGQSGSFPPPPHAWHSIFLSIIFG